MRFRKAAALLLFFLHSALFSSEAGWRAHALIGHVKESIGKAEAGESKLIPEVLEINGLASSKVRNLMNHLCSLKDTKYLEAGAGSGAMWIAAMYRNEANVSSAMTLDNALGFSLNVSLETFFDDCDRFIPQLPFEYTTSDCFIPSKEQRENFRVNTFFYNGYKGAYSHEQILSLFDPFFEEVFIAIIDGLDLQEVPQEVRGAFQRMNYQVLYEVVLPSKWNGDPEFWWNSLYIAVLRKL